MGGCFRGMGVPGVGGCSRGMRVPGGWVFQGDECSRGMSVLGDGCLGGWEFHNSISPVSPVLQSSIDQIFP